MCWFFLNVSDFLFCHWWRSFSLIQFLISWFEFFFWFQNRILKFLRHEILFFSLEKFWMICQFLIFKIFFFKFDIDFFRFDFRFWLIDWFIDKKKFICFFVSNVFWFRKILIFFEIFLNFEISDWRFDRIKKNWSSSSKATKINSWTNSFYSLKQWELDEK